MNIAVASFVCPSVVCYVAAFAPPIPSAEPYRRWTSRFHLRRLQDTVAETIFSMAEGDGELEPLIKEELVVEDSSDFEPLAEEGPWQAFLDDSTTGLIYYYNVDSNETVWLRPTSTFPKVMMSAKEKGRIVAIRQEYATKQKSPFGWDRDSNRPSFLNSLYDGTKKMGNYPQLKTEIKPNSKIKRNPYRNNAPIPPNESSWIEDMANQLFKN